MVIVTTLYNITQEHRARTFVQELIKGGFSEEVIFKVYLKDEKEVKQETRQKKNGKGPETGRPLKSYFY